MKTYIAGPITGIENYKKNFETVEKNFKRTKLYRPKSVSAASRTYTRGIHENLHSNATHLRHHLYVRRLGKECWC